MYICIYIYIYSICIKAAGTPRRLWWHRTLKCTDNFAYSVIFEFEFTASILPVVGESSNNTTLRELYTV
jgi:hypothetical protein